jgi:hypothetical protein
MDWDENHSENERLAGQAEVAAREGNRKRAAALYREAAEAESRALASVDPTKMRTLGITAVSAVSLYYKAGEGAVAADIGQRYLDAGSLPEFAQHQIREILDVIRRERLDKEAKSARVHRTGRDSRVGLAGQIGRKQP